MSNHIVNLIGRSFHATIGEPWDFESGAGQNRLEGKIHQIVFSKLNQPLIICNIVPFVSFEKDIFSVVAVNRYIGRQNPIEELSLSNSVTLNFMFQRSGAIFKAEDVEAMLEKVEDCSFLVGTMTLE